VKPIIFSAQMVRAILEGRKTQTRRIIKPQPRRINNAFDGTWEWKEKGHYYDDLTLVSEALKPNCPYGGVGDKLWVRETWRTLIEFEDRKPSELNKDSPIEFVSDGKIRYVYDTHPTFGKLRPSIFMPRWASRITLEITEIRVERLKEITPEDCIAEGISPDYTVKAGLPVLFAILWDSLNAKRGYPWDGNWWVWRIPYRLLI